MKKNFNLILTALLSLTVLTACNKTNNNNNKKTVANSNAAKRTTETNTTVAANNSNSNASIVINNSNSNASIAVNNSNTTVSSANSQSNSKINVANFNKMEVGMNYSEVVKLLGSEGEGANMGSTMDAKTVMYKWNGPNGAFLKAIFQNGMLVDKVHTGLK